LVKNDETARLGFERERGRGNGSFPVVEAAKRWNRKVPKRSPLSGGRAGEVPSPAALHRKIRNRAFSGAVVTVGKFGII